MEIINVNTFEELKELYNGSALTIEGLYLDSLDEYEDYLAQNNFLKEGAKFWIAKGALINAFAQTRYPADLNVVCVKLDDMQDIGRLAISRFSFGGRWFDDIIDNARAGYDDEEED